jgi:hypothetical protein
MTDADLDRSYSALAEALTDAGPDGAPLMLSMVCLALMARMPSAGDVLPVIEQARRQFAEGGHAGG